MVDYRIPGYGEGSEWDYPPSEEDPTYNLPVPGNLMTPTDPLAGLPLWKPSGLTTKADIGQTKSGMFTGPSSFATMAIESAKALPETVARAIDYPAASLRGEVDPLSDEGVQRAADAAGTVTLGGGALPAAAPKNALRSGLGRPGPTNKAPLRPKLTAAIYGPDGNIYVGPNHGVVSDKLPPKVKQHFWDNYNPSREGFVDERGNFLTREQAYDYGEKHGLFTETLSGSRSLSSEDLGRAPWDHDLYALDDGDSLYSNKSKTAGAVPLFSKLEREVSAIPQKKASGQQWSATIGNKQGIPREEVEWTGVTDWLKERGTLPVTKEELLSQIQARQTRVGVKRLGVQTETYGVPDRISTRHGQGNLVLPGGENYREVLLTLPTGSEFDFKQKTISRLNELSQERFGVPYNQVPDNAPNGGRGVLLNQAREEGLMIGRPDAQTFTGGHWDEPNVLAHMRVNDRTIERAEPRQLSKEERAARGETSDISNYYDRVLFAEEIQDDWAQKANAARKAEVKRLAAEKGIPVEEATKLVPSDWAYEQGIVPNRPFKKTWPDLILKRLVADAIDGGYDAIAWTDGATQAARYNLRQHVEGVYYYPDREGGTFFAVNKQGHNVIQEHNIEPKKLPDYIGKEAADRLLSSELTNNGVEPFKHHSLEGDSLEVGGEGMKSFYDQELPRRANKLFGRWGAKVEDVNSGGPPTPKQVIDHHISDNEYWVYKGKKNGVDVWQEIEDGELLGDIQVKEDGSWKMREKDGRSWEIVEEGTELKHLLRNMEGAVDIDDMFTMPPAEGTFNMHILRITPKMRAAVQSEGLSLFANKSKAVGAAALSENEVVGYHGTQKSTRDIIRKEGFKIPKDHYEGPAIFLTDNPLSAYDFAYSYGPAGAGRKDSKVLKTKIDTTGFKEIDLGREIYDPDLMSDILKEAVEEGFPGVIIRNIKNEDILEPTTTYAVFDKTRVTPFKDRFAAGGAVRIDDVAPLQRRESNPKTVEKYKRAYTRGEAVDPVMVMSNPEGGYFLLDGHHRLEGAQKAGVTELPIKDSGLRPDSRREATDLMMRLRDTLNLARRAAGGPVSVKINGQETYQGKRPNMRGLTLGRNTEDRRASQKDKVNRKNKTDRLPFSLDTLRDVPMDLYNSDVEKGDPVMRTDSDFTQGTVPTSIEQVILENASAPFIDGLINDPTPGRTDRLPTSMPADSYVIPADIVSGMGQGNTLAGAKILDAIFSTHGSPTTKAGGGGVSNSRVPVIVAGGEYVVSPDRVRSVGSGDASRGHKLLDSFTRKHRVNLVKRLKSLPGPRVD